MSLGIKKCILKANLQNRDEAIADEMRNDVNGSSY